MIPIDESNPLTERAHVRLFPGEHFGDAVALDTVGRLRRVGPERLEYIFFVIERVDALRDRITTECVRAAFAKAGSRWAVPGALACESVADMIRTRVAEAEAEARFGAGTRRTLDSVRRLHAALADDLPALDARLGPILATQPDYAHALADLVAAAAKFRELFPPPGPRSGRRSAGVAAWQTAANEIGPMSRHQMMRANPGRHVAPPHSAAAPVARVMVALLFLGGHRIEASAVAQHFRRYPWRELPQMRPRDL